MYSFSFSVIKSLFTPEALMKAAYSFLDIAYIHFAEDVSSWIVEMSSKGGELPDDISDRFENELLAQEVRSRVANRTKSIRDMIMARSMTSTLVNEEDPIEKICGDQADISDELLDEILKDWFDEHE